MQRRTQIAVSTIAFVGLCAVAQPLFKTIGVLASSPSVATDYIYPSVAQGNLLAPTGLALANQYLLIADTGHNQVKIVNTSNTQAGIMVLGNGTQGYADGVGNQAEFAQPIGVGGSLHTYLMPDSGQGHIVASIGGGIEDVGNRAIRTFCYPLTPQGCYGFSSTNISVPSVITRMGGNVNYAVVGPTAADVSGTTIVDAGQSLLLRAATANSQTTTHITGNSALGYQDGPLSSAQFRYPTGVATFSGGSLIADSGNNALRLLTSNNVSTFAGNAAPGYADGSASQARFYKPSALVFNSSDNSFYVADTLNSCIRRVDTQGNTSTYAGKCTVPGLANGALKTSQFNKPAGIAISGSLMFVSDSGNNCVRLVDMSAGQTSTFVK